MADSGIYQIRNLRNGKLYIGSARDLKQRRATHFKLLGENRHHCRHLQAAWNKYGAEAFVFELVEHVGHVDRLIPREQHYIDTRQPEYNTCRIAGSRKGTKQSDTAKAKISRAHKSVWNTSQRRAKHDEILRKRWDSTDQRVKQGLRSKKRWGDPEFREKTVAAQKAVWDDPEYRAKRMKGMRGAQSPRAIKVKYTIRNKDGVTLTDVPFRLRQMTGMSTDSMGGLMRGRYKTARGWSLVSE